MIGGVATLLDLHGDQRCTVDLAIQPFLDRLSNQARDAYVFLAQRSALKPCNLQRCNHIGCHRDGHFDAFDFLGGRTSADLASHIIQYCAPAKNTSQSYSLLGIDSSPFDMPTDTRKHYDPKHYHHNHDYFL